MTKDVFSRRVEVARFRCVVGGTEQQCHSFKDYTHVGVFQISYIKRLISNLSVHFLALELLTVKTPFCAPYMLKFIIA